MSKIKNYSDFDVNILDGPLSNPNIELSFPLPTDEETLVPLKTNKKTSDSFRLLEHFINFCTSVNVFEIYKNAEYKYSVNKMNKNFNIMSNEFMRERLEKTDEALDEIVYKLVESELRMNLIKAKQFPSRFKEVKDFMVKYYTAENKKNLPNFGTIKFIRLCYITVIKIVTKMFPEGVWVNKQEFNDLYQKYLNDPMSIILLPNHQSHIDYVILHLIMIRFQMSIPTVIAGENLNVAIFGSILKGLGAIFIKRSFNNELYTERNLTNYIEFVFLNKIHFEVFIEGTRSRDGKLLLPKYGILKTLSSIYFKQKLKEKNDEFDLLIQPISITYERIYEADGYLKELVGGDKEQESFVNILKNGLSNMFSSESQQAVAKSRSGFIDNTKRTLSGKLFVKLADSFTFSSYVSDPSNSTESAIGEQKNPEKSLNLKKLGFKVLHAINDVSHLPESSLVGITIQTFYYLTGKKDFSASEIIPMMDFFIALFQQEQLNDISKKMIDQISNMSPEDKENLIESQIIKLFKFTMINPSTKQIKIVNSFELLYYKNLTIHLIIHRCLVSFILLKTAESKHITKLYYIFTGILKNEFLFDYDYNENHELSHILRSYRDLGLISSDNKIQDEKFHRILATVVEPFVQSFFVCVSNLNSTVSQYYSQSTKEITEQQLINDSLMSKDYPTTKSLLKLIQKDNTKNFDNESSDYRIETFNKQYLLSFIFYLDNLDLIQIIKNKSKTKAYVLIRNSKDLQFIDSFMRGVASRQINDIDINYMIDIVDKIGDRQRANIREKL